MKAAIDILPSCLGEVLATLKAMGIRPVSSEHSDEAIRLVIEGDAVPDAELVDVVAAWTHEPETATLVGKFRVLRARNEGGVTP